MASDKEVLGKSESEKWLTSLDPKFYYRDMIELIGGSEVPGTFEYLLKALNQVSLGQYSNAIKFLNEAINLDPKWGKAWYYKVLLSKLTGQKEDAEFAFEMVKKLGFDKKVPLADIEQCFRALRDENESIRLIATDIFRELRYRPAVLSLIHALQFDSSFVVRWRAADALGKIGDPLAMEPLIRALNDENPNVRGYAALALGRFGINAPVIPLIPILRDTDYRVRDCAAEALGSIGSIEAANLLLQALEYEEDFDVRIKIADSLYVIIINDWEIRDYLKKNAMDLLFRTLWDEDGTFRHFIEKVVFLFHDPIKIRSYSKRNEGCILIFERRYAEAIKYLDEAIALDPSDACSWYHKGVVLGILGLIHESHKCFDEAIRLRPSYAEAWAGKGGAIYILCVNEMHPHENDKIFSSFINSKQYDLDYALMCVNRALKMKPALVTALYIKSKILKCLGQKDESKVLFSKSEELIRELTRFASGWSTHCSRHIITWMDTDNELGTE